MAAHRYWRIYVRGTTFGTLGFSEIELRSTPGGSDLTGSGTATSSSHYSDWTAAKAVDNNTGTAFETYPNGVPQWWAYDFGAGNAYEIAQIAITPRTDGYYTAAPRDFAVEFSDDGAAWTQAVYYTLWNWPNANQQLITVPTVYDFAPHDLTSNSSHAPFVASASAEAFGSYGAWKAFNGNVTADSSKWVGGTPAWIQLDIGSGNARKLISYDVQAKGDAAGEQPKDWTMKGSNDGSSWDTLDTVTNQTAWGVHERRSFTCDVATTGYRYFRLDITANNGDANYTAIEQLYLFGEDAGAAPAATSQPVVMVIC